MTQQELSSLTCNRRAAELSLGLRCTATTCGSFWLWFPGQHALPQHGRLNLQPRSGDPEKYLTYVWTFLKFRDGGIRSASLLKTKVKWAEVIFRMNKRKHYEQDVHPYLCPYIQKHLQEFSGTPRHFSGWKRMEKKQGKVAALWGQHSSHCSESEVVSKEIHPTILAYGLHTWSHWKFCSKSCQYICPSGMEFQLPILC